LNFAKDFIKAMAYRLRADAAKVDVIKAYVTFALHFMAVLGITCAMATWGYWRRSRSFLLATWLLAFTTPFATSTVPARLLITWDSIDADVLEFVRLTRDHYNVDKKVTQMMGTAGEVCNQKIPDLKQNWEKAKGKVQSLCSIVRRIDVPFYSGDNKARSACRQLPKYLNNADKGVEITLQACDSLNRMWQSSQIGEMQRSIYDAIKEGVVKAKLAVEMTIGFGNALSSFKAMWPTAISIAPGLIKAALRAKVIIPQSSIPGIFVVLLPWLFAPLTWSLYNIAMQLAGSPFLLVSLFLFAFYPLAFSVIGWWGNVTAPMEQAKLKKLLCRLSRSTNFIMGLALCFAIVAVVLLIQKSEEQQPLVSGLVEHALSEIIKKKLIYMRGVIVMVLSYLSKLYLTALTGVDWMLHQTAEQRQYENMLKERSEIKDQIEGSILDLWRARQMHLDGLAVLNHKKKVPVADDDQIKAAGKSVILGRSLFYKS